MITMETVRSFPFVCVEAAITYYRFRNPARQKSFNPLDPERRKTDKKADFSGESPADVWASVCAAIVEITRECTWLEREVFRIYYLDEHLAHKVGAKDVALILGISKDKVYRILNSAREELERELVRRELLEPPPDGQAS